jgi:hypothetical protein
MLNKQNEEARTQYKRRIEARPAFDFSGVEAAESPNVKIPKRNPRKPGAWKNEDGLALITKCNYEQFL